MACTAEQVAHRKRIPPLQTFLPLTVKTIYKYPIWTADGQTVMLPKEFQVIHVGLDPQGTACLWAIVEPTQETKPEELYLVGTGNPLPPQATRHLGSFVQGSFVWHAFLGVGIST